MRTLIRLVACQKASYVHPEYGPTIRHTGASSDGSGPLFERNLGTDEVVQLQDQRSAVVALSHVGHLGLRLAIEL